MKTDKKARLIIISVLATVCLTIGTYLLAIDSPLKGLPKRAFIFVGRSGDNGYFSLGTSLLLFGISFASAVFYSLKKK